MSIYYISYLIPAFSSYSPVTNEEVTQFWTVFSPHDREGIGLIRREDFFSKIVSEPRTFFGDSILDFIDCDAQDVMTFGEFVETICLFSLFERNDVLRCMSLIFLTTPTLIDVSHPFLVLFYLFDKKKTGYVDRDELKHFIVALHGGEVKSNAQLGLSRVEEKPRHDFKDIRILHRDFPHLLYPVFRLQISMMRISLGERWWDNKKIMLAEEKRIQQKSEQSQFTGQKSKGTVAEEAEKFEQRVKDSMGSNYYFQFWKREAVRIKLKKMDLIDEELNLKIKQQQKDEEDDELF